MSTAIAISGKGGSGKTTVAAMIVRHLVERTRRRVLAVDADPNSCLGLALGLEPETTVAEIREATLERKLDGAETGGRERAFEYAIQRAVTEGRGFDLLAMGLPEGPKCYCAVNHLLRKYLDAAGQDYRYLVTDNEAGMEHLSRRTTDAVDYLVVVAEPTPVGILTARRILGLSERLPIAVRSRGVLWNKVPAATPLPESAAGLHTLGSVPYDNDVAEAAARSASVFELAADNPAYAAVGSCLAALLGDALQQTS
jgi:CO dehydrogenase maturation factor